MNHYNWIPVQEGLPAPEHDVLVCDKNGDYRITCLNHDNTWFMVDAPILYWCYLPHPPIIKT